MLDVAHLRNDPDGLADSLRRRGIEMDLDALASVDRDRRQARVRAEELRSMQKASGKEISNLEGDARAAAIERAGKLSDEYKAALAEADALDEEFNAVWVTLPNLTDVTAADGLTEDDNVETKTWGTIPEFEKTLDHVAIGEALDIVDVERAAKVSGSRFGYIKGGLVRLELALVQWVLDELEPHGFRPVVPPVLVREHALFGTGFFPGDKDQVYSIEDEDLYLVGTSEVPLAAMHADEIFSEEELPLRYAGFSTCFRRESGTYGKDTRGIFRVHQFDKVEMFSFCHPDKSQAEHDFLLEREESLVQQLNLPYRVVNVAAGDLGSSAAKKYDIEAWFPGQERYREITSTSNTTDYQSRRLKIRFKDDRGNHLVHTLNGTAMAIARMLIAIIENNQLADGTVSVPEVLRPYCGLEIISG
jgi:seryl-tRNA synthetase